MKNILRISLISLLAAFMMSACGARRKYGCPNHMYSKKDPMRSKKDPMFV